MVPGLGLGFAILEAWSIGYSELEFGEEKCQLRLSLVESLGCFYMTSQYLKWVLCSSSLFYSNSWTLLVVAFSKRKHRGGVSPVP